MSDDISYYFRCIYLLQSKREIPYTKTQIRELATDINLDKNYIEDFVECSQFRDTFKKDGVVVLKHIYPLNNCKDYIKEIWEYWLSLPYKRSEERRVGKECRCKL